MGELNALESYMIGLACEEYGWTADEIKAFDIFNGVICVNKMPRKTPKHLLLTVIVQEEKGCLK